MTRHTQPSDAAIKRAKAVRLLLLDVDGVLTDGTIYLNNEGIEAKGFNIKDGLGLNLLKRAGIEVGIITGRHSAVVAHRARELGIGQVVQGCHDKLAAAQVIAGELSLEMHELAFAGDDLIDLKLLANVGLALSVADGVDEVQQVAHHVATVPGGRGAVREMCELILKSQGLWDKAVAPYR